MFKFDVGSDEQGIVLMDGTAECHWRPSVVVCVDCMLIYTI